ncbi:MULTISPECIES: pyridoxal kinase [Myroides]|uniref:pyridoxal kinase n=1 Tax=Myroides TaxID=76831 RepID=UPI0013258715|nr:pyridoxal kinase [Myroides sp. LoEW2-1]MVX37024.1 pyridoxal kinase [Myroides sp. LoEW2-1]
MTNNTIEPHIISIQSTVSTGYVGNNSASFAIQLHGINCVAMPTILLSSHTDKPVYYGEAVPKELFDKLARGVLEINTAQLTQYVVSGYLKSKEIIDATAKFIKQLKAQHSITYIYDPVFGDTRTDGLYIPKEQADYSKERLLSLSDILTPNHFELEYLLGKRITNEQELITAVQADEVLSSKIIVLTTAEMKENVNHQVEVILINQGKLTHFYADNIPVEVVGTGDLFTGTLSAQLTKGRTIEEAIQTSMNFLSEVLRYVHLHGLKEMNAMAILQAQDVLAVKYK